MTETTGAEVQVENGFTRIHPAILEALAKTRLTGQEFRAVLFLLRRTYGWQKKEDAISLAQWMDGLGLSHRHHVRPILDGLVAKKIIYVAGTDPVTRITSYGFNKYFEQWLDEVPVTPQGDNADEQGVTPQGNIPVTPGRNTPVTPQGNIPVTPQGNHKRNSKETPKDKGKKEPAPRPPNETYALAQALAEVCNMQLEPNKGQLLAEAKRLLLAEPHPTPDEVASHYGDGGWWWMQDWRGQKGEWPKPSAIRATWGQWLKQPPIRNGANGSGPRLNPALEAARQIIEENNHAGR